MAQSIDMMTIFFILILIVAVMKVIADTSEAIGGTFLDDEQNEKYQKKLAELQSLIKEEEQKIILANHLAALDKLNKHK